MQNQHSLHSAFFTERKTLLSITKITVQVGEIFFKTVGHIYGTVFGRNLTFNAVESAQKFQASFGPQDKDDGRYHIAEHTAVFNRCIDKDGITYNSASRRPSRLRVENMMIPHAVLYKKTFIITGCGNAFVTYGYNS